MAKIDRSDVLAPKTAIVAAIDLVGVPAGTEGKVTIVNGLTWIRYWVRFSNGVVMGSIDRKALATPQEWARKLAGGDDVDAGGTGASSDAGDDGADDDGAGVAVNGVVVPNRLLERSKAARARLAA